VTALTSAQIPGLGTAAINALTLGDVSHPSFALSTSALTALSTAQIEALTTAAISTLSLPQIAALTSAEIPALTTPQIGALTTPQLNHIGATWSIVPFTAQQIAVMSVDQLNALYSPT
jgi:hypothetical protein